MRDLAPDHIAPRPPSTVMRLERMGSFHATRLSFMRILMRRMKAEGWTFHRSRFDIDARGVGIAIYSVRGPERTYSLIAFGHDLPKESRSDRVIATAWDATFTLFDGVPSDADIERLRVNVPLQEVGRITERELSLSRANRSVRMWDHVVDSLASGRQPDISRIAEVGYLMRTTAVYGSGKMGAADRAAIRDRPELHAPFQVEMLNVYLIRVFVMDLVEHVAALRAPDRAVALDPDLRRRFGIGNSTGLGMAPFLINHPALLNSWIAVREEALARLRRLPRDTEANRDRLAELLARTKLNVRDWRSDHPMQREKIAALGDDITRLEQHLPSIALENHPWDTLWRWAERQLSVEGQEQLASLLPELHPELVDGLADCLSTDEETTWRIDGTMSLAELRAILWDVYGWALEIDWSQPDAQARVWYTSEEKLEPRLGERAEEDLAPYEQPLCPGRDAARLYHAIGNRDGRLADFLLTHPEHRHLARRAQIAERLPYAEIRDNTLAKGMMPIDLLRAKLSFFGATHFDPRSDRWVRINMFRGAPFPDELADFDADAWAQFAP